MMTERRPGIDIDQTQELRRIIGGTPNKPPHAQGNQDDKDKRLELFMQRAEDWFTQTILLLAGIFIAVGLSLLVIVITAFLLMIGR